MKVGILGGSFNPIHNAHIQLSEYVIKKINLDKMILVPAGDNPFKVSDDRIKRSDRYHMVELAIDDKEKYEISDIEINKPGNTYTVDTLIELRKKFDYDFYFIMGSDLLPTLTEWKMFSELCKLTKFVVLKRKGVPNYEVIKQCEFLYKEYGANIIIFDDYYIDNISSSMLREKLALKDINIKEYLDSKVYDYIMKEELYFGN